MLIEIIFSDCMSRKGPPTGDAPHRPVGSPPTVEWGAFRDMQSGERCRLLSTYGGRPHERQSTTAVNEVHLS